MSMIKKNPGDPGVKQNHPSSDIQHPSSIIQHLSSIIYHPTSIIHHLSSITQHPSSIFYLPSSIISHLSSIIRHPSSITIFTPRLFVGFQAVQKRTQPVSIRIQVGWRYWQIRVDPCTPVTKPIQRDNKAYREPIEAIAKHK